MSVPQIKDIYNRDVTPEWVNYGGDRVVIGYKIRIDATYDNLVEYLGKIRKRVDGRFDWFRDTSHYYKSQWSGGAQGVADSVENAKVAVEKGWFAGENKGG